MTCRYTSLVLGLKGDPVLNNGLSLGFQDELDSDVGENIDLLVERKGDRTTDRVGVVGVFRPDRIFTEVVYLSLSRSSSISQV